MPPAPVAAESGKVRVAALEVLGEAGGTCRPLSLDGGDEQIVNFWPLIKTFLGIFYFPFF